MRRKEEIIEMRNIVKQYEIDHSLAMALEITLNWVLNETAETPESILKFQESL